MQKIPECYVEVGHFQAKFIGHFSPMVVPPFAARISPRRLVAKVGTFENKKVRKHLHLWPLGSHRRRLAVTAGMFKGSTISQYGCSTFRALATEGPIETRSGRLFRMYLNYVSHHKPSSLHCS